MGTESSSGAPAALYAASLPAAAYSEAVSVAAAAAPEAVPTAADAASLAAFVASLAALPVWSAAESTCALANHGSACFDNDCECRTAVAWA